MKKIYQKLVLSLLTIMFFGTVNVMAQGTTTSSLNGRVLDGNGEPIPGATVIAVHGPTGTEYGNSSDFNGYFRIANMNAGGPYTITISSVGFENYIENNVFLTLGQAFQINAKLSESVQQLNAVEVVANPNDVFDGNRTGQQTVITEETINEVPTIGRNIQDYWTMNPMANIQPTGQNATSLSASIGGMNARMNSLYIDGAVNNDVFGLSASGTNGGQTGVAPISMDAIGQFQVSVAPFDVTVSGFAGGAVNAVTRSGTNEVEGSAYYFLRNQNLAGKTPTDDPTFERQKLDNFSSKIYGMRLGGALVKNKVFYFINAEGQDSQTPQPFDAKNYSGASSIAQINNLVNVLKNDFNYNPGGYTANTNKLTSQKFLAKIDWNLSKVHKLTFRHSYVHATNISANRSSVQNINFYNTAINFPSTTNSSAIELKSNFANSSNHLTVTGTLVNDNRNPNGANFPFVKIYDGSGTINIGSEQYSTANQLKQNIFTFTDNFELYKGKHTLTFGTHNEIYYAYNLFMRQAFGSYTYPSVASFLSADSVPTSYARSYSLVDNVIGDGSKAAAQFHGFQLGFYAQDEFQANERLKMTLGLRLDIPTFNEPTPTNSSFNNTTISQLQAQGYSLDGARTGKFIGSHLLFAPRFGFNYDVSGDKSTQLRGGIGVFNSRVPLVWPGGAYNNTGTTVGGVYMRGPGTPSIWSTINGSNPIWQNQPPTTIVAGSPSGQIDLFSPNFKLPQVAKLDIAVDQKLPWGMVGTFEFLYTKFLHNLIYSNLNLQAPQKSGHYAGAFSKLPYYSLDANKTNAVDKNYSYIMLAQNTNKGYAYNLAATLSKQFTNGFQANVSYSYGDSYVVNDLTSSQNNSQWRYRPTVIGRNYDRYAQRSINSMGHRIFAQVSYKKKYLNNHMGTQLSLIYNGQSGTPFSYVYADGGKLTNANSASGTALMYIPKNEADAHLVDIKDDKGNVTYTAHQEWVALDNYIKSDKYLDNHRGEFSKRNVSRTPFRNILDLRILQDFYLPMANGKTNTLQLSLDIFNFTNLLNKNWGRMYYVSNNSYYMMNYKGTDASNNPTFTFDGVSKGKDFKPWNNAIIDNNLRSSRWQMQVGVRYIFN